MRRTPCPRVRPVARALALTAGALAATLVTPQPADAGDRRPLWPSELRPIAAPLLSPNDHSEAERQYAVGQLADYADPVILPYLAAALDDPAVSVQRAALDLCLLRQLERCGQAAERLWRSGDQESVRTTALAVLALDTGDGRGEFLFAGLREDSELMRAHAALLIGQSNFDDATGLRARRELVTKLADASPRVRRSAATSLGRLGPGEGALALVRVLDDPDLSVREAAAEALGGLGDPRAAPSLRRILDNAPSEQVAQRALASLARLADEAIDRDLLLYLDSPPPGLARTHVVDAIGRRPTVSEALVEGLIARLGEPELADEVIRALRALGDRPLAALERARERGLAPSLQLEVDRLIAARSVVDERGRSAAAPSWPTPADRSGWLTALAGADAELAAAALATMAPDWAPGALRRSIQTAASAGDAHGWLLYLALAGSARTATTTELAMWTRVTAWANERAAPASERCLATWALGAAVDGRAGARARRSLQALAGDSSPLVRACAATALASHDADPTLEALLADADPRVRGAAALALLRLDQPSTSLRSRLATVAVADRDPRVRALARLTRARARPAAGRRRLVALGHASERPWLPIVVEGVDLEVPAVASAGSTRALVPSVGARLGDLAPLEPPVVAPPVELILQDFD